MDQPDAADPLAMKLMEMVNSNWISQSLTVTAQLGIPDLLAGGPRSSEDLAQDLEAHAPSLRRLLRALVTLEIVREGEDGTFELLPLGEHLRADAPLSLRSWTIHLGRSQLTLWGQLLACVKTGESARRLLAGTEGFQHLEQDAELAALFNQAMVDLTRMIAPAVVQVYDFSGMSTVVDVGGGYGALLAAILQANPEVHGILFDLPHAIEQGQGHLQSSGLAERCQFVAGSFFEAVPDGGDAYVLKSVIHNWNDERSQVILENCRRAMTEGAKLVLVERVMPERLGSSAMDQLLVRSDLNMLVALAAPERTEADFRRLLQVSGFHLTRTIPAAGGYSVLEAVPA